MLKKDIEDKIKVGAVVACVFLFVKVECYINVAVLKLH